MKKYRYTLKPRVKIFIALCIVMCFSFVFIKQQAKMQDQRAEVRDYEQKISKVKDENEEIQRRIEYAESEDYKEKVAREALGWVKKGEIKFIEKKKK